MQVILKLYASLATFLPEGAERNMISLEVAEGTTVRELLDAYNLPPQSCHLVLLNGVFQHPAARHMVRLKEGDAVAAWPPVAGG